MGMSYAPSGYQTASQSAPNFITQQNNAAAKKGTGVYKPKPKAANVKKKNKVTYSTSAGNDPIVVKKKTGGTQIGKSTPKKATPKPKAKVVTRTATVQPRSTAGVSKKVAAPAVTGATVQNKSVEDPAAQRTAAAAATPEVPNLDDWYNQDSAYQATLGGLGSDKTSALARLAQDRTGYDTDFVTTLKNLGWDWDGDQKGTVDGYDQGNWDASNDLGAYAQGKKSLDNDFASRGLLDSSFFADAANNYNTDMNNQFSTLTGGRTNYMNDRNQDESDASTTYTNALAQAKAESAARRANKYGLDTGA